MAEPGRGLVKWFFYPGYTPRTGGLLREPGLAQARHKAALQRTPSHPVYPNGHRGGQQKKNAPALQPARMMRVNARQQHATA